MAAHMELNAKVDHAGGTMGRWDVENKETRKAQEVNYRAKTAWKQTLI